jgi:hypothetical protein
MTGAMVIGFVCITSAQTLLPKPAAKATAKPLVTHTSTSSGGATGAPTGAAGGAGASGASGAATGATTRQTKIIPKKQ